MFTAVLQDVKKMYKITFKQFRLLRCGVVGVHMNNNLIKIWVFGRK